MQRALFWRKFWVSGTILNFWSQALIFDFVTGSEANNKTINHVLEHNSFQGDSQKQLLQTVCRQWETSYPPILKIIEEEVLPKRRRKRLSDEAKSLLTDDAIEAINTRDFLKVGEDDEDESSDEEEEETDVEVSDYSLSDISSDGMSDSDEEN